MDWSQIYDEAGDDLSPTFPVFYPPQRLKQLISFAEDKYSGYTYTACYIFTINYILGVGCLGVPFGFARAGIVLGSLLVVLITVISYITVCHVAETVRRAEVLATMPCEAGSKCWLCFKKHTAGIICQPTAATRLTTATNDSYDAARERADTLDDAGNTYEKNYEVISLTQKFLGNKHVRVYQVSLMSLMYVGLLAYSQVFANSLSSTLSFDPPRSLLALVFAMCVLPLSLVDLESQITIQAAMAVARFVAIFIMVAGSVYALLTDPTDNNSTRTSAPYTAPSVPGGMSYTYDFGGFGVLFSTALFSQLFQHSVPGLIRPLPAKHKKYVNRVFAAALSTTCFLYLLLGITAAVYFGATTSSSINLNFTDFYYGLTLETATRTQLTVISVMSQIVVLFPALDTLSVFPLICNTLGNNLSSSTPFVTRFVSDFLKPTYLREGKTSTERRKAAQEIATGGFRLVAAIPPIILSIFCNDLAFSLQLAGVAGLYVAFVCPCLLQIRSIEAMARNELNEFNEYSGWWSGKGLCYAVLSFATAAGVVVFWQIWQSGKELWSGQ